MPWGLCSRGWMLKGAVTLNHWYHQIVYTFLLHQLKKLLSYNHNHHSFYFGLSQLHWRLLNLTWQVKLFVLQKWKLRRSDWWEERKQGEWRSYSRRLDIRLHSTLNILNISCEYLFQLWECIKNNSVFQSDARRVAPTFPTTLLGSVTWPSSFSAPPSLFSYCTHQGRIQLCIFKVFIKLLKLTG